MGTLAKIREYFANPKANIDFDSLTIRNEGRVAQFRIKPLSEVLPSLRYISEGHFSQVFNLNDKWVAKVDCNTRDENYEAYADYCMANPGNPWMPRIRAKIAVGDRCRIYIVEKLQPLPYGDGTPDALHKYLDQPEMAHCDHLRELLEGFGTYNMTDVRRDNMMMRLDGQVVLTDPCSRFYKLGKMRTPRVHGFQHMESEMRRMQQKMVDQFIADAPKMGLARRNAVPFPIVEVDFDGVQNHAQVLRGLREQQRQAIFGPRDVLEVKKKVPRPHQQLLERNNEFIMRHAVR